ncbi:MAG: hypothetical protein WDM77_06400 [Steroidobacteraceae bacterium]
MFSTYQLIRDGRRLIARLTNGTDPALPALRADLESLRNLLAAIPATTDEVRTELQAAIGRVDRLVARLSLGWSAHYRNPIHTTANSCLWPLFLAQREFARARRARAALVVRSKLNRFYWLARYWVMDKYNPQFRAVGMWIAIVLPIVMALRLIIGALSRAPKPKVQEAYGLVGLIILIVIELILAYALRPKPQNAQPEASTQPTTKDGRALRRAYGTNWIDDSSMTAWVQGTPESITSGGKK